MHVPSRALLNVHRPVAPSPNPPSLPDPQLQLRFKARLGWSVKTQSRSQRVWYRLQGMSQWSGSASKGTWMDTERPEKLKNFLMQQHPTTKSVYSVTSGHITSMVALNTHKNPRGRNANHLHFTDKIVKIQVFCP